MLQNGDWYPTEALRIAYIFSIIIRKAQRNLDILYLSDYPLAFKSIKDIIEHLASCFEVIDEQADARDVYSLLRQYPQERFRDFKIHFLDIANRARISQDT